MLQVIRDIAALIVVSVTGGVIVWAVWTLVASWFWASVAEEFRRRRHRKSWEGYTTDQTDDDEFIDEIEAHPELHREWRDNT